LYQIFGRFTYKLFKLFFDLINEKVIGWVQNKKWKEKRWGSAVQGASCMARRDGSSFKCSDGRGAPAGVVPRAAPMALPSRGLAWTP
jgi:hypothetical protein